VVLSVRATLTTPFSKPISKRHRQSHVNCDLRNLGGIIIVDFIDMAREDHREAVLAEFRKQLGRDRVKTMAGGFRSWVWWK